MYGARTVVSLQAKLPRAFGTYRQYGGSGVWCMSAWQSAVIGSAEMAPEMERAVPACSRVMTRSTGCVISVATAPEAQPATKSAVFSAIAVVSRASSRGGLSYRGC